MPVTALELRLFEALTTAHPEGVELLRGPRHDPHHTWEMIVEFAALKLVLEPPKSERQCSVRQTFSHTWKSDGEQTWFSLPAVEGRDLVEIQAPPGHVRRRDDHYVLEPGNSTKICFYQPPPAGEVVGRFRSSSANTDGYSERRPCTIEVDLICCARDVSDADDLMRRSLGVVLAELAKPVSWACDTPMMGVRFYEPSASLESLERSATKHGRTYFYRSCASILVRAQVELTVLTGDAAEPNREIERVAVRHLRSVEEFS